MSEPEINDFATFFEGLKEFLFVNFWSEFYLLNLWNLKKFFSSII